MLRALRGEKRRACQRTTAGGPPPARPRDPRWLALRSRPRLHSSLAGQHAWHHQIIHGVGTQHAQRVRLLLHRHGAQLGSNGAAAASRHDKSNGLRAATRQRCPKPRRLIPPPERLAPRHAARHGGQGQAWAARAAGCAQDEHGAQACERTLTCTDSQADRNAHRGGCAGPEPTSSLLSPSSLRYNLRQPPLLWLGQSRV